MLLERAAATFAPEVAMFVGIAGGRKDVRRGDVVAADAVYDYESGKDSDNLYLPRIKTAAPSFALVQRAQAVVRHTRWQERIMPAPPTSRPSAFVKPIAAGGKVVAHDRSSTAQFLAAYCGDALAVDMESYGFLRGAYVNDGVATLVVRGISDLLSDKTAANDGQWQLPAARNAAAFAFEVLDTNRESDVFAGTSADRPPADRWVQENRPARGGTVYANQGGDQTVYVQARDEERHGPR
jgi:nucleoside phosphorylase